MLVTRRPGCWTRPTGVEPASGSKPVSAPSQTTTAPIPFPSIDGVGASAERRQTTSPPLATCCWPRASTHGRPSSVRNTIKAANRGRHPDSPVTEEDHGVFVFVTWETTTGEILRLYTHPRRAGSEAARALLDRALDALRATGHAQASLNMEARNERARRF